MISHVDFDDIDSNRAREEKRRVVEKRQDNEPLGWDGQTLAEMKATSEELTEETGRYRGIDEMQIKEDTPFQYERMYSRLRGALVSARETALHVSASPIVRELGELCFQIYTPEGDCVALSTGIIVHVHTGSLAIKYMIDEDYEAAPGIEPGDIFTNNDNEIGNIHTSDIHTFVPIFRDGELVAWVDGVTHEVDIGGTTPGGGQLASSSRYDDGHYATCRKTGENDQVYKDWREESKRAVRTPELWELDEKCRISGCHMIRDALHGMIDDVGVDTFKQFMGEAVEEGRQTLKSRVQERLFPGTYRAASFMPVPFEDEAWKPEAQQDMLNHLPVEMEVESDGTFAMDMDGASPPGPHPWNVTEGGMSGGLWVMLAQCLLHDSKVNDGSHFAIDANFPEGSVVNPQDPSLSYHNAWVSLQPSFNALWKGLSTSFFARGFREEVMTGYSNSGDGVRGDGTIDETGEHYQLTTFELTCCGNGASAVRDGLDYGYVMWNPEVDMGDIENWERLSPALPYLGRSIKTNTAGHGKYRGGSGWEVLRTVVGSSDFSLYKQILPGVAWDTGGMSGGYPAARNYTKYVTDTDLEQRLENEEQYPVSDSPVGSLEANIDSEVVFEEKGLHFPRNLEEYDVFRAQYGAGPGWGDPLERPVERVIEDVEDEVYTPDIVENVYGVGGDLDEGRREFTVDEETTAERRSEILAERETESTSYDEWWESERDRVEKKAFADPLKWMYSGVFEQSDDWHEQFVEFWDLDEEYDLEEA
jgi:N-methylhydantoinase B/oxoprolinase/acetone carboxylase alpha subunit